MAKNKNRFLNLTVICSVQFSIVISRQKSVSLYLVYDLFIGIIVFQEKRVSVRSKAGWQRAGK